MSGAGGRVTSGERRRRRPTRSGGVLSDELIIETARRLIEVHGSEGLTVRRLGAALGADPTAIYRYFENTDDLLLAVADVLIGETLAEYTPGEGWKASLRNFGKAVYRLHHRHPRLALLVASRVTLRENESRAVELGIGLMREAGFAGGEAVRNYHAFIDTVLGFASLDAAWVTGGRREREFAERFTTLPADDYPNLDSVREHLPMLTGSGFETALDLLLDALEARAPGV